MKKAKKKTKIYELTVRGKWIYGESKSINEMIEALKREIKFLEMARDNGVKLNAECAADDYFFLVTDDEVVAREMGMEEVNYEE